MFRSRSRAGRAILLLFILFLSAIFLFPKQSGSLLQHIGKPVGWVIAWPLGALAVVDRSVRDLWERYVALRAVREENRRLRYEIQRLQGQNTELREIASAAQRLAALLGFMERNSFKTLAAQVIGRDSTNWYRAVVLNKGERDGVRTEMGVITPAGVVGRVVKTAPSTAMVLLLTDPNNAVAGLIQRTRDEGLVEGTAGGLARIKYVPLLSTMKVGDTVVTSGLTGGFPKGLAIGAISRIEKDEGELFQNADIVPEVDFSKLEEVLVITSHGVTEESLSDGTPLSADSHRVVGP